MEKKREWERAYDYYVANSTKLDERIEYLTDLTNGKVAMKEEYEQLKKLTAIKANLSKVKNILELREKLNAQKQELESVIKGREKFASQQKEIEVLEEKMSKLEKEYKDLQEKIKNPDLKPEEKVELQNKIKENEEKRNQNNIAFGNLHEEMSSYKEDDKYKEMSMEELKQECIQISMNISKCNLACNKLMKGYSWKSVEVALDRYEAEKLTAKGKNAAKMKQNREAAKARTVQTKTKQAEVEPEKVASKAEEPKKEEPAELIIPTRWQRFKGKAKELWEKWFVEEVDDKAKTDVKEEKPKKKTLIQRFKAAYNKFMEREESVQEETKKEEPAEEKPVVEETETKADSFRQYLRDIAEKGIDDVEQEKADAEQAAKQARMQAAKERLEANRAAAQQREAARDAKNNEGR